ncbi:DUF2177 family protein [Candidatus Dependentiae bacterium]|nr:DUF2177 family protein [Candidatus Dependentiae bacterium]
MLNLSIEILKKFLISLISLITLDIIWIGVIMNNLYRANLSKITKISPQNLPFYFPAALITWILIVLGAFIFVRPLVLSTSITTAVFYGALYGFILYAVYDFTNYATLPGWQLNITIIDIFWGTFICSLLGCLIYLLN